MDYLTKTFSRPFQDWKKFGIAAVLHLTLFLVSAIILVVFMGTIYQSLGINPLDPNPQIDSTLTEVQVAEIVLQNIPSLIIGGLLTIILGIIITSIIQGWFLRCMNSALKNKSKLPNWNNFMDLFKKGFILSIIYLIYIIALAIPLLLYVLTLAIPLLFSEVVPTIAIILTILLFLLFLYTIPMIEVFYSKNYKFKEAFDLKRIFKKAFTWKYLGNGLVILLILIGIGVAGSIVSDLLTVTIIFPILVNTFIYVYTGIFFSTAFANLYKKIK